MEDTNLTNTAQNIINYVFQNCGALVSKKDYDFIIEELNQLLAKYTMEE